MITLKKNGAAGVCIMNIAIIPLSLSLTKKEYSNDHKKGQAYTKATKQSLHSISISVVIGPSVC